MADKLMYIPNDDKQNYQSKFTKVHKVVKAMNKNKENVILNFGDLCKKQPIVPSLSVFLYPFTINK